jgi:hypothetical protein
MSCPVCNGREVGKIGANQFFCWNCLLEFNNREEVFEITEDGSLLNFNSEDEAVGGEIIEQVFF